EDHVGETVRDGVERGEALEEPHGVVGAQYRRGGAKADAFRAAGYGGKYHLRRRDGEVLPVVLAQPDEIHPHAVGEHTLRDYIADDRGVRHRATVVGAGYIAEAVASELEMCGHVVGFTSWSPRAEGSAPSWCG